jgi:hypothetical protein
MAGEVSVPRVAVLLPECVRQDGGVMRWKPLLVAMLCLSLFPALATAQQTGTIVGKVADTGGGVLPGVTVEATSNVLPTARVTVTGSVGEYRMPALPPGTYKLTFTLAGMGVVTKEVGVQLAQDTVVNATLNVEGLKESVTVTAAIVPIIEKDSASIKSGLSSDQIQGVPVGQEYRDLIKLIPGVQFTQDTTRGPSAGGSGQDNIYKFDGVNVTMPLFGTLSAEPASHDIAQVTTTKGGAKAVDFDRSGGFSVDSVSKSGTSQFSGMVSYQIQDHSMTAKVNSTSSSYSTYQQDKSWLTANLGGPVLPNKAYFYGSYYRPTRTRQNASNLYGELPNYDSTRNEGFGKLTLTPISSILVNLSYRRSHRLDKGDTFSSNASGTTGAGSESWQRIATADASWVINSRSYLSLKYTHFENPVYSRPDHEVGYSADTTIGTVLDVNNLDKAGLFSVPTLVSTASDAYNAFAQTLINKYGYTLSGVKTGGGTVGYYNYFDEDSFYRDAGQLQYNITFGSSVMHDLHVGYQVSLDAEDLKRSANGWGYITAPGGRLAASYYAYYQATLYAQGAGVAPKIRSEILAQNIEANDTIKWKNLSVNLGLMTSRDILYGQGLKEDKSTLSGYVASTGHKYNMYDVAFSKMLQPRVGVTWAYNGNDTVYASYARYNPAASSLPRAAAWDRSFATRTIYAYFDEAGSLFKVSQVASSSGKLFVEDMTPRRTDEFLIGSSRQITPQWSAKIYGRYRYSSHFWEDTNNTARVDYDAPASIPHTPYISDLSARLAQIGSGSSYVIAELDGAYTRFYEVTMEQEWRVRKAFVRGSYTYSHYWGNFDQDNTTSGNDANIFIGSSNIGDGAGCQLWNFRDGTLRGDRPHMLKVYGYYELPWQASIGSYVIAQSGQPWEKWSYEPYIALTTSTSDAAKYAERAGSRRTPNHYQMDLNYTQNVKLPQRFQAQLKLDLFNIFDKQTGYNYQPAAHSSTFGLPRTYMAPRLLQASIRIQR